MSPISIADRMTGGLLGLLVGDALGVPVEFLTRRHLQNDPVTAMRGYGSHNQPPGTWSDDSSLALCTLESLTQGYSPADMMARFRRWLMEAHLTPHGKVFDVGITTREAILWSVNNPPPWGGTGDHSNGNGSLMRILPLALFAHRSTPAQVIQMAGEVSALTHAHPRSRWCCAYLCLMIQRLLQGDPLEKAMTWATGQLPPVTQTAEQKEISRVLSGRVLLVGESAIASGGYVVHCLEAAIWCVANTTSFDAAVLKAVNLGGDSDTTGAVTGAIAGVVYGADAIPSDWLKSLARRDEVESMIRSFVRQILAET